ncbi:MAG: hypothetical protein H7232_02330 [Aeromicrobium sp.]|nr:hypothetical protein [Burkholderiales bacterium]
MKTSATLPELEDNWKEYLGRLERVWFKAFAHYKKSPKWHRWQEHFEKERKDDPLLSYLRNARGADEHTVADIVEQTPGLIEIVPGELGGTVARVQITSNGVVTAETTGTAGVVFNPARIKLLPIVNRGVTFGVPTRHQGITLNPENIVSVAEVGLHYYEKFLNEADTFFAGK